MRYSSEVVVAFHSGVLSTRRPFSAIPSSGGFLGWFCLPQISDYRQREQLSSQQSAGEE
jgi:hypothetical protein